MSSWRIRELRADDLEQVAELWNESMAASYRMSIVDKHELESLTFKRQTFDREASFIAEEGSELVGFVISFAAQQFENDSFWHMIVAGWIGALMVSSPIRRGGLGSQLLERAEEAHEKKGRLLLLVGGGEREMGNFLPGLEEGWLEAKWFFEKKGYLFLRRTCYINIDLGKYKFSEDIKEKERQLKAQGFSIGKSEKGEEICYRQFCLDMKRPDVEGMINLWRENPTSYLVARSGERIVAEVSNIKGTKGGKGGYSAITTLPEFRRMGIGKVMLAMAVEFLKKEGAISMPLWTRPATYEKFYAKLGFGIEKNYDVYGKKLSQALLSRDWIARYQDPR